MVEERLSWIFEEFEHTFIVPNVTGKLAGFQPFGRRSQFSLNAIEFPKGRSAPDIERGGRGILYQFIAAPLLCDITWTRIETSFQCNDTWEEAFYLVSRGCAFLKCVQQRRIMSGRLDTNFAVSINGGDSP